MNWSDEETVAQITENPHLQYFIGFPAIQEKAPFDASFTIHFRKRLDSSLINQVNEWIVEAQMQKTEPKQPKQNDDDDSHGGMASTEKAPLKPNNDPEPTNQGKLLIDATCVPADIVYPTDLRLLNDAREKLEGMIDTLHEPYQGLQRNPRTYRKKARKEYLAIAKQRNPRQKTLRKAIGKQLNFVRRNLLQIEKLADPGGLESLSRRQYRELLVIQELYHQQRYMHESKTHQVNDWIVSIEQPYVRPIVRGKADANVEFGAEISVSMVDSFSFLDKLEWNAYHEGKYLQASVEAYRERNGAYLEAVFAYQIYRTRENRAYCKKRGIRLSGPKLGRPSKDAQVNAEQKRIEYQDAVERNPIEGKFSEGKRKYDLGRISARLQETAETVISLQFLVMNLEKILRDTFFSVFSNWINKLFFSQRKQLINVIQR